MGCHSLLQGIFPTRGLNPHLLHYRQILYREIHGKKISTNKTHLESGLPPLEGGVQSLWQCLDNINSSPILRTYCSPGTLGMISGQYPQHSWEACLIAIPILKMGPWVSEASGESGLCTDLPPRVMP